MKIRRSFVAMTTWRSTCLHLENLAPSPYINRFLQPDTLIPDLSNPQSWNRYSYVTNRPVNFNDPTGHREVEGCGTDGKGACVETDPQKLADNARKVAILEQKADEKSCRNGDFNRCGGVQGFQLQITLSAGADIDLTNGNGETVDPLIFYGVSFVIDKHGGFQLYGLTRDLKFDPYFSPGSAEDAYPMDYTGAGVTIAGGVIRGTEFAAIGTDAYAGRSVDWALGGGPISVDHYELFDEAIGTTDATKVSGDDIGISLGFPVSGGSFAMFAHPMTRRIGFPIRDPYSD